MGNWKRLVGQFVRVAIAGSVGAIELAEIAIAQLEITADTAPGRSLGTQVQRTGNLDLIRGGTRPQNGANLFHSFQEFNVREGRGVYFASPDGVRNILSRVTGSDPSNILGTLGTFRPSDGSVRVPGVNLFLINPNGIVFGPNASLDIGGSFYATTANALQLGDTGLFSASQPESSNLLTVDPSAFLFNAIANQNLPEIVVQSRATRTVLGRTTNGLQVPDRQDLLLLGGNVKVESGLLNAYGGRVEIGAVAGAGTVELNTNGSLQFPDSVQRADVSFTRTAQNAAQVNVRLNQGGDVGITARNISLSGGSLLLAGIRSGFGAEGNQAGDVILNSIGEVRVEQASQIQNDVDRNAIGNAGNIQITARDRVLFQGTDGQFPSAAFTSVEAGGRGNGGNVVINAPILEVRDGAELSASTFGTGDAGNVVINAPILEVRDRAQLLAKTRGTGDAGNVQITARDRVLFQGSSGQVPSAAFSSVGAGGSGKGGNVVIDTSILEVHDGAQLIAGTLGTGDAGNVQITARDRVLFQGSNGQFPSAAFTRVEVTGTGKGGNVVIDTPILEIRDGAQLSANTLGTGDAGNVQITARDRVVLDGTNPTVGISSGIFTDNGTPNTTRIGNGAGGNVVLTASQLTLSNGAVITALTTNDQPGGTITLRLGQLNLLSGGQIFTTSNGSGPAGTITITAADQIRISGSNPTFAARLANSESRVAPISANSGLYVRSSSTGAAGDIVLTTPRLTLDQQGRIDAQSSTVSGGNIFLTVPRLLVLRNGSQISATAGSGNPQARGNGGNITIYARFIVAIPKENSDITANASRGRGGNVFITSQGIFGLQFRPQLTPLSDITASSDFGASGIVNLNTPDNSAIQNSLTQLSDNLIDPNVLLASSCIVRRRGQNGTFLVTGSGGLPVRPGDPLPLAFPTGEVRTVPEAGNREQGTENRRSWKLGDPIVEPQDIYRLPNGKLVMSRECQNQ